MNVYFVRHGQSEANKDHIIQDSKVPLSKKGKNQAKLIAKRLKGKNIDVIYASPYIRTKQTAEVIAKELGIEIEYWESLRERKRPTKIEGLRYDNPVVIGLDDLTKKYHDKADWKHSDDESFNDLVKRAKEVEDHLFKHHRKQNVLCVSHGGFMKMLVLNMILKDKLTPEVFWQFYYHSWTENTGITHINYTKRFGWGLIGWNDMTHL